VLIRLYDFVEANEKAGLNKLVDKKRFRQWLEVLRQRPTDEVFEALIGVFCQRNYFAQQCAGELLLELNPPCPVPAQEAIRRVLPTWNASVEEVPLYFAGCMGLEAFRAALEDIEFEVSSERERRAIDTFRYWIWGSREP
jgi:hypothetical protein